MVTLLTSLPRQALSDEGQLFSRVVSLLNIQPMLHVDYTATASSLDLLAPHQNTLEELSVASAQWDPLSGPLSGSAGSGADLVLCNHTWAPARMDPAPLVANLAAAAKPQGFVLLHTLLRGEALGDMVAFLSSCVQSNSQGGLLTQVSTRSREGAGVLVAVDFCAPVQ